METNHTTTILLVESDEATREILAGWLGEAGYTVMTCPGPLYPEYVCVGGRGKACPLAKAADLVVLDLDLASDYALTGTPGRQLQLYYLEHGNKVLARAERDDPVMQRQGHGLSAIAKSASRDEFLAAVVSAVVARAPAAARGA